MRFRERESPGSSQEWGKSGLGFKSCFFFSEFAIAAGLGSNGASHPGTLIYLPYNFKIINCHSGVVVKGLPIPHGVVGSTPLMGVVEMIFFVLRFKYSKSIFEGSI